ncbi:CRISPR-associated helicase Cas3' [Saccharibacillus brassicae]|uniref:CRISPR-associated helicase Cas3 n=1 Tax=Saccharibacillus brassicae TaxID=2583377 RepID=A0A4Y6USF4_SACBS|nr:CRISPR-associated helicase Cas3' [Saccharibacillus brassicae]QDH19690.1 CRISPR-associated helicase Cas3' [Saccharibacillus brassicae]
MPNLIKQASRIASNSFKGEQALPYYAHTKQREDKSIGPESTWQLLRTHLTEVERLAGDMAKPFGAEQWAKAAGRLHDLGKYSEAFQHRLKGSTQKVDHATAGALALVQHWSSTGSEQAAARLLAYVIAGHHSGLPDYGTSEADHNACLRKRLSQNQQLEDYSAFRAEIVVPQAPQTFPIKPGPAPGFQLSFFTRMLFSCLVDADSLNTEAFSDPSRHGLRKREEEAEERMAKLWKRLRQRFYDYRAAKFRAPRGDIDRWRTEIFEETMHRAADPLGLFSLTLPTGSGKTQVSLGFALEHAVRHGLRRILYVIPYTSIIEQNAQEFRDILGDEHVLEHHSNFQHSLHDHGTEAFETTERQKLAEENWELPLVVTTNVQFFESLFASRRSPSRKLHNIAGSIIVLDEAQMMNGGFFRPCLYALDELVRNYGCSVLFCTATQPPAAKLIPHAVIRETVADPQRRYEQFERVEVRFEGRMEWADLAEQVAAAGGQALCIVNTRGNARELHATLANRYEEDELYHLSARMCPKHRRDILDTVKQRLRDGLACVLVSTQLIEAGVDIDFPVVYRELAGLDSIAQAAGRCNRNGRLEQNGQRCLGQVHVFETEKGLPEGWMSRTGEVARDLLVKFGGSGQSPLSIEAVQAYFSQLFFYGHNETIDQNDTEGILPMLEEGARKMSFPFKEVGHKFRLIDSSMKTLLIPYVDDQERAAALERGEDPDDLSYSGTARRWLDQLRNEPYSIRPIMRALQPYTVQLYPYEFEECHRAGELDEVREGIFALARPNAWYEAKTGIKPYSQESATKELWIV